MANPEHLKILLQGATAWNWWRAANPNIQFDLSGADLFHAELPHVNLQGANLRGVDFSRATLKEANLSETDLREAKLTMANMESANLSRANLENADLMCANMSEAILACVRLQGANTQSLAPVFAVLHRESTPDPTPIDYFPSSPLTRDIKVCPKLTRAYLNAADLRNLSLRDADLSGADLSVADLSGADLTAADLSEANLTGANLRGANIERADLRRAVIRGIAAVTFDQNEIRGALFTPYARDMWSVLRRSYTGPRLLFHLLLLIAFFVPYTLETVHWIAINQGQVAVESGSRAARKAGNIIGGLPAAGAGGSSLPNTARQEAERQVRVELAEVLRQLGRIKPCLADDCIAMPVWQMMLGLNRGWIFGVLSASLILYNISRVLLTWTVGALREEEERSGYTPALKGWTGYLWLYRVHQVAFVFLCINVCSLAWHLWDWLSRPVLLPKV